ncbi:endonuclease MutS2 [Schnuerera ultunensis]|uniref:Endonuclease MutS2 n=1 Tax=[Clostridium] ultunense Esp TaxID=1288971 RepID=A0A1M4PSQ2_9FIRM|nr:endonuclease MutS2 [Schnuerera ultunensis]SHD78523.1 putative DNA mismatch repair enzyme [[Clostridium] ultunense Esp]
MNEKTFRVLEYKKIVEKLAEKAESELGKKMVKEIKPSISLEEVEYLQRETKEALELIMKNGNPPLFGIFDISHELKMAEIGGTLNPNNLLKVSDSLRVSRSLKKYMKELKEEETIKFPILQGLISSLRALKFIEDEINNAIINENEISDNASPTLRNIRRQIINKNESIRNRLNSIISSPKYKKFLQDSIVTMREGRYVVPIKQENKAYFPGLVHDQSSSGATLFVEPMAVVELNNELRELEIKEREEIERILKELSALVAEEAKNIRNNQNILQRLDFIFAKGKLALEMDGTKPLLNKSGYIDIKQARHPLLEPKEVVPIDIYLGKGFNTLVITGPNTGGKTVTLKTVGLLTLMAQSGIHIPADFNSQIGVFDQIFADIGDEQSIEQSLSTFSSHMTNIVDILDKVEQNSLILFDELGAGTDPTEGAALAMSILDHLLKLNIRTIATTHYSQLKIYALTTDRVRNASVEFDVETLSPTYRLLIGVPGKSNAFEISKRLGLQGYIIDYAKTLVSKENVEFEDVLQAIDKDRKIIEENRFEAERLKSDVEKLKEELTKEKEKTKAEREKIITRAKEEARSILRAAKEESDHIVTELRHISTEIEKDRNKKIQEAQEKLKSSLDQVESSLSKDVLNVKSKKIPKNLKIGEMVEVLSLNQIGNVLELPDENGNVQVQVGIMKVNVHISTLRRAEEVESEKTYTSTKKIIKSKSSNIKNEIDVRGSTLDEALLDLDKYIDDAYIAGLKEAYIIHGKGTGVLREGIKSYVKGHKNVKSFRSGKYGEGGEGVTVIELK